MSFGINNLDKKTIKQFLYAIASMQSRHFVVMEVRDNLVKEDRKETMGKFRLPNFKKVAQVMVGEPKEDFKPVLLKCLLKAKQEKANLEFKAKQIDKQKKKMQEMRQKQV